MKRVWPIFLALLVGCADRAVPGLYAEIEPTAALPILRQQAAGIYTLSAQGFITLTKPGGDSIRLDAALVARMPGELHLRAWKFNRTIFDLTLTPAGMWFLAPEDPRLKQKMESGKAGTIQFARAWNMLSHDFFFSPDLRLRISENILLVTRHDAAGSIVCTVDRPTLQPRQYALYDPAGHRQFVLRLSDYGVHDGIAYPAHLIGLSRLGQIDIRLRQIQINQPLSPAAFVPSPRAEKLP